MTYRATFPTPRDKVGDKKYRPTKKALVEAIIEYPEKVHLTNLSAFGGWSGRANELPIGYKADVVGPDPYKDRRWYATVSRQATGLKVR